MEAGGGTEKGEGEERGEDNELPLPLFEREPDSPNWRTKKGGKMILERCP